MNRIVLFFWLFCVTSFAQNVISGEVFDEYKQPLAGVSVYFDGTTIGTTTNQNGQFQLSVFGIPNAALVISFIGYETFYPSDLNSKISVILKPIAVEIKEVVVESIPFSRKDLLKVFRQNFLGTTKAGNATKIRNEDAIHFEYDSKSKKITAFTTENLQISNAHLGYEIAYTLLDFELVYFTKSLAPQQLKSSFYSGTSFFKEVNDPKKAFEKKRIKSYNGSPKQFFKNLVDSVWNKKNFLLFEGSFQTNPHQHFKVERVENTNKITILNNKISQTSDKKQIFYMVYNLLYNNSDQSGITFRTPVFYVDDYGNNTHIDQITFSGVIGDKRVGDMLPLDYVLSKPTQKE